MEVIRLMADYECYPLWWHSGERVGNIDPSTLPLSKTLVEELLAWADRFDETYNSADPAESGFPSVEAMDQFDAWGMRLWRHLQADLADKYRVVYKRRRDGVLLEDERQAE
ncbi:MAG: hypothetical protein MI924_30295 [Chloroflexales bacterium]|nr:hypothetical protein [Chloroflexales bacterium]